MDGFAETTKTVTGKIWVDPKLALRLLFEEHNHVLCKNTGFFFLLLVAQREKDLYWRDAACLSMNSWRK